MSLIVSSSIFIASGLVLFYSGRVVVRALSKVASFLEWREFVLSFVVIALMGTIPNLFVGISAALHGIPELSFGDVVGGNVIDLTLVVALSTLIAGGISVQSKTAQTTSIFTVVIAVLPLLLILDGRLGRGDGIVLMLAFVLYMIWLFSKRERFTRVYDKNEVSVIKEFKVFLKELGKALVGIILLLLAAEGIVRSGSVFAQTLSLPLPLVGMLIIGLGNSLPEAYFALISARSGQTWMILGDLMGAVIMPTTLVLGLVALIHPIAIANFSPYATGRLFLIASAVFFLIFIKTQRKISKKEAVILLLLYITFVISEILIQ